MTDMRGRLLLVDDSVEFLAFMESLLQMEGFIVESAKTLDHARAYLATALPDAIISDVRLPDAPPFAVLDLLETDQRMQDVPLLLCTGAEQEVESAKDRLARKRTEVLLKPFDIDDLLSAIDRLLHECAHP